MPKKVLILTSLSKSSPRIPGMVKWLPAFGWKAIVITPPFPKKEKVFFTCIETGYKGFLGSFAKVLGFAPQGDIGEQAKKRVEQKSTLIKSLLRFVFQGVKEVLAYPDEDKNWIPFALHEVDNLLRKERIDAIISSSSPVSAHIVAKKVKERYKIPWIADLRDLWSQNHNYGYSFIRRFFDRRLEIKTLKPADYITTVSWFCAQKLKKLHRKENVCVITNSFDPDLVNDPPAELSNKFTITYTGQIYTGKQDPLKLLIALRDLISEKIIKSEDIQVRFYGPKRDWLEKKIKKFGLTDIVKQYGIIDRIKVIGKQRESQLLLLFLWEDPKELAGFPSKIFEYLAARRPILATGGFPENETVQLLKETKAGVYAQKVKDIKEILKKLYFEYKQKGKVDYYGDLKEINKYSQIEMAKKFVNVLNQII